MRTLILSDIHLGNNQGLDIYAGGGILPAVIDRAAAPETQILLNGDTVDFLMNEDPLVLDVERAVAAARAIAAAPESAAVFLSLGRALTKGAEVIVRLGNHDVELALTEVQEVFRDALGVPPAVGARLVFQLGDAPMVLDVAGARVLVTHGEQNDNWNKVDYVGLSGQRQNGSLPGFQYPPGTRLVKTIMNRLKREHGLRFADLLKPDFQGAVLTALAVAPDAVRELFQSSTLDIAWQLFRQSRRPLTFNPSDEDEPDLGFASRVEAAGLSDSERRGLLALTGRGALSFGVDDAIEGALARLGRAGLSLYAAAHRLVAGSAGERYFSSPPTPTSGRRRGAWQRNTRWTPSSSATRTPRASRWRRASRPSTPAPGFSSWPCPPLRRAPRSGRNSSCCSGRTRVLIPRGGRTRRW